MKSFTLGAVAVLVATAVSGAAFAQTKSSSSTTKPVASGECPDGFVLDSYNRCVRKPR